MHPEPPPPHDPSPSSGPEFFRMPDPSVPRTTSSPPTYFSISLGYAICAHPMLCTEVLSGLIERSDHHVAVEEKLVLVCVCVWFFSCVFCWYNKKCTYIAKKQLVGPQPQFFEFEDPKNKSPNLIQLLIHSEPLRSNQSHQISPLFF